MSSFIALFLENITPVIIALIGAIGLKWQSNANIKVVKKIDSLQEQVNQITITLDIKKRNEELIRILNEIKTFYIKKFEVIEYRNFASFSADIFVHTIESIISNCDISVRDHDAIEATLRSSYETVRHEMIKRFGIDYANVFINAVAPVGRHCLLDLEEIITDTENHRLDRFVQRSNKFLKEALALLKACEVSR